MPKRNAGSADQRLRPDILTASIICKANLNMEMAPHFTLPNEKRLLSKQSTNLNLWGWPVLRSSATAWGADRRLSTTYERTPFSFGHGRD